jgi:pimeloyl-ACP methyl ester carboxylesterase
MSLLDSGPRPSLRLSPLVRWPVLLAVGLAALSSCATQGGSSSASISLLKQLEANGRIDESRDVLGNRYATEIRLIKVPERRGAPKSEMLSLPIMIWKALRPDGSPPLFLFNGGPGDRNFTMGTDIALAERRDVVLVGYRGLDGTRRIDADSRCLAAADFFAKFPTKASYRNFKAELARAAGELAKKGVDLSGYTIGETVEDIEAARISLGYGRIDLYGVSFGSRIVQAYLKRYPDSSRRAVVFLAGAPADYYGSTGTFASSLDEAVKRAGVVAETLSGAIDSLAASPEGRLRLAACDGSLSTKEGRAAVVAALRAGDAGKSQAIDAVTRDFAAGLVRVRAGLIERYLMLGCLPALKEAAPDFFSAPAGEIADHPLYSIEADLVGAVRKAGGLKEASVAEFGGYDGDMLIASGELDPFDPADRARDALLPLYPRGSLIVFKDTGHEQPFSTAFWTLIDQFLSSGEVETRLLASGGYSRFP